MMNRDWVFELYRKVREAREKELERILALLRPKADKDPEVREALGILEQWVRKDPNGKGADANKDDKPAPP